MPRPPIYHDLITACAQPGCPVCNLVQQAVSNHIRTLLASESLIDPKIREELRYAQGFCAQHTWLMLDERLGDALGVSILYQDILNHASKRIQAAQAAPGLFEGLRRRITRLFSGRSPAAQQLLSPEQPCPACKMCDSTTHLVVGVLVDALDEPALVQALSSSGGLCLPHMDQALQAAAMPRAYQALQSICQARIESLRAELGEFIRKSDYRFSKEPVGSEGNAWKRAANLTAGEKGTR
jgi:hypothetical protein